jgi:hypothetical protein
MENAPVFQVFTQSNCRLAGCLVFIDGFQCRCGTTTSYNFRHLTSANGLSNSTIRAIAKDKYGLCMDRHGQWPEQV